MAEKSAPRDVPLEDYLTESLRDPAEAAEYLEAAIEAAADTCPLALRQVAQARGVAFSDAGTTLLDINRALKAMGLKLRVQAE